LCLHGGSETALLYIYDVPLYDFQPKCCLSISIALACNMPYPSHPP